jgi:hypothetical protein
LGDKISISFLSINNNIIFLLVNQNYAISRVNTNAIFFINNKHHYLKLEKQSKEKIATQFFWIDEAKWRYIMLANFPLLEKC